MQPGMVPSYTNPQMAPAQLRPEASGPYTNPQMAPVGMRPDMSGVYTNPQMAPAMLSTSMPVLVTPVIQPVQHSPHDYTLSRSQMATALGLTAILSGLIGSLGTLLILRSQQQSQNPQIVGALTSPDPRPPTTGIDSKPVAPEKATPTVDSKEPAAADGYGAGAKTSGAGQQNGVSTAASLNEPATMPPKQNIWTRPAAPAGAAAAGTAPADTVKAGDGKPQAGADVKAAVGDAKPGLDGKDGATFSQTSSGRQDTASAYQAGHRCQAGGSCGKPAKTGDDGLRNPFAL